MLGTAAALAMVWSLAFGGLAGDPVSYQAAVAADAAGVDANDAANVSADDLDLTDEQQAFL